MNIESYTTVLNEGKFEYEDRRSVFIGTAVPVRSEEEALDFISYIKKKYPDARHHVYAYVLRENSIMRFSDDREPQGTAGLPVLDAIRKRGCTNVAVVVIRYFGGTLLGTGGLVRAYSAAAVGAIENASIVRYDIYDSIELTCSYSDYQKVMSYLDSCGFKITNTEYADNVIIYGKVQKSNFESFNREINEVTAGRAKTKILEEIFDYA